MRQVLGPGAVGRPRGIGWRGRWEGGSGWGTHVNPWLIHVNVWQKPLQYCKVISLQLIKINGKKRKECRGRRCHPWKGWRTLLSGQRFVLLILKSFFLTSGCQQGVTLQSFPNAQPTETVVIPGVTVLVTSTLTPSASPGPCPRMRHETSDNEQDRFRDKEVHSPTRQLHSAWETLTQRQTSLPKDNRPFFLMNQQWTCSLFLWNHSWPF